MTRTIDIPFNGGQNEGADRILLPATELRSLQNARLTRDGRLEVRPGYTSLGRASVHTSNGRFYAFDLTTFQGNLVALGTTDSISSTPAYPRQLFTYIGGQGWAPQIESQFDQISDVSDLRILYQAPYGNVMSGADIAYTNGFLCCATFDQSTSTGTAYILEAATGVVVKAQRSTSIDSIRCCAVGNLFVIVVRTTAGSLNANTLDTTDLDGGFSSPTTIVTTELTDSFSWDLSALGGTSDYLVSYSRAAASAMRLRRYTTSHAVVNTADVAAKNGDSAVIGDTTHGVVWAIRDGNAVEIRTLSTALSVTAGPTDVIGPSASPATSNAANQPALAFVSSDRVVIHAAAAGSLGIDDSLHAVHTIAAHTAVSAGRAGNVRISSKLYTQERTASLDGAAGVGTLIVGGNAPGDGLTLTSLQFYASCIQHVEDTHFCSARWNYGIADKLNSASSGSSKHGRSSVATDGAGKFWACVGILDEAGVGTENRGTLQVVEFKGGSAERRQTAEMQGALYVAGGFVYYYDRGTVPAESGFLDVPVIKQITQGTAGALTALATYQYVAVYEWLDALGRVHRSSPSAPKSVTLTGSNDETFIQVSSPRSLRRSALFSDGNAAKIVIYRTQPNDSVFFRVCETSAAGSATYADVANANDQLSDAVAATRPILYTQSQKALANVGAQPCRFIAAGQDRMIYGGAPDPNLIQLSQLVFPNEPLENANPNLFGFQARLPEPCTGVAALGDQYVAFTADAIYLITGAGPQRNGQGEFFPPQSISSDGGCIDWRSIVSCGLGTFFQLAPDKLYILRSGGQVEFIGQPVRDTLETYPVITGSCLCSARQQVVFSCTNEAGDAGVLIIYDLRRGVWSVDTIGPVAAVTEYDGRLAYLLGGLVYLEDEAIAQGSDALPTLSARTGSLVPFGVNGWGTLAAVQLLGTYVGDSTVEAFISYDDGKTWTSMGTVAATAANSALGNQVSGSALSSGDPIALKWYPQLQNVARFALRFDLTHATNTGGMRLHAASIEVEGMAGTTRLAAGATR